MCSFHLAHELFDFVDQGDNITWLLKGNLTKTEFDKLPRELRKYALSTKDTTTVKKQLQVLQGQLAGYTGGALKKLAEAVVANEKSLKIALKAGATTLVQRAGYLKAATPATIVTGLPDVGRSGIKLSCLHVSCTTSRLTECLSFPL